MSTITRMPLFLRFNLGADMKELFMGTARTPRGCDATLNLGLFAQGQPLDLTNVATLKLEICDGGLPTSARLVSKTINAGSLTPVITKEQFGAGATAHAIQVLTADEMNPDLGGAPEKRYTLILTGHTAAATKIFYGSGDFVIFEDGNSDNANPPPAITQPTYMTTAQVQAVIAALPLGLALNAAVTTLTGGAANALDRVSTAALPLPTIQWILIGDTLQGWLLYNDAVTAADGKFTVQPVDYNVGTNPRLWKRVL